MVKQLFSEEKGHPTGQKYNAKNTQSTKRRLTTFEEICPPSPKCPPRGIN